MGSFQSCRQAVGKMRVSSDEGEVEDNAVSVCFVGKKRNDPDDVVHTQRVDAGPGLRRMNSNRKAGGGRLWVL